MASQTILIDEIYPSDTSESAIRVEFWGDEIDSIETIDPASGSVTGNFSSFNIYPANLFVTSKERIDKALAQIDIDLSKQVLFFDSVGIKKNL